MSTRHSKAHPHPSNFAGRDEHFDAEQFARALRPPPEGLHVLHNACPPVTPLSSGLDVLLFRAVLLVAYAAADEVVIARGSDLDALRRLPHPHALPAHVTALAFRERDAAVAVAFRTSVVVFEGWSDRAKENSFVYDPSMTEVILDLETVGVKEDVVSLSWNAEGTQLCAIADCIVIWKLQPSYMPVKYSVNQIVPSTQIPTLPLAMGAISPNAAFVAASGLYTRVSYVWSLAKPHPTPDPPMPPCTEIVHGRSGIATLDWKKRGGGNPALMTADRDGTLRIWVKASAQRPGHTIPIPLGFATGTDAWMEEIARSPHVERTPRSGAAFLNWGGGGGVADDEGDAMATNAANPLLAEGTAPKPSRCYHWIIRIAGGDARAWRVKGLDDRPRAEFTRLEPGSGEPLLGTEEDLDDAFRPPDLPLRDVAVAAMKAVAPIPLTTASTYKIGLVKSYAISNGERRLRSPEPPEPPNLVAIFVLSVRNGLANLARYDICPTSTMPAICRARIGVGHTSEVVDLVTSEQSSTFGSANGGWLASRGETGDVILWRTNVSTGAWDPVNAVAALPGPHTAVAFAPLRLVSRNLWEVGVFTCDSALGSLRLFRFVSFENRKEKASVHDIQFAKQASVCHPRGRGSGDVVNQLVAVPLGQSFSDPVSIVRCAVFGVRSSGRLCVWAVARRRKDEVSMEPSVLRFVGSRHGTVTCAVTSDLAGTGRQIFVSGGGDGSAVVYIVGESETEQGPYVPGDSEDDEEEEGVIWLRELCQLPSEENENYPVESIEVLKGGSRILVLQSNGNTVVWLRSSADSTTWESELTVAARADEGKRDVSAESPNVPQQGSVGHGASIGFDHDGNFSAVIVKRDGIFERYRRVLGMSWECVQKGEAPCDKLRYQKHVLKHIGKGVFATSNGMGISVLGTAKADSHPLSFVSGAAGYSPSKSLFAHLLTGGRAWQVIAALDELHAFVRKVTRKKVSETSYRAGRGLIPPPPSLSMLLSEKDDPPTDLLGSSEQHSAESTSSGLQLGSGREGIFARLMAKSEAKIKRETVGAENMEYKDTDNSSNSEDLSNLASRLKVVSLAGVTRTEQSVLAAIARASSSLRSIFKSLDPSGAKFALMAACHLEISRTDPIPLSIVASAVHSSSTDALMNHFLPPAQVGEPRKKGQGKMWDRVKILGAGWWLSTTAGCKKLAERMARADFNYNKNPDDAALWYIALGRGTTLAALYRSQQNTKMSQFLRRNFNLQDNQLAAGKNAYVLVSKHRLQLAVAFFILANDIQGALNLIRTRIKDDQLAIFLARILQNGEYAQKTIEQTVETSSKVGDDHRKSLAQWLCGRHEDSLMTASKAGVPLTRVKYGEADRALAGSLPAVVYSLAHVLAIVSRPPIRGSAMALSVVDACRSKAIRALLGDGSPVAALVVNFAVLGAQADAETSQGNGPVQSIEVETSQNSILLAAVDTLKGRAVCLAGAVRSGATEKSLQHLLLLDIQDLSTSILGVQGAMKVVENATFELSKEDEVDAAVAATCAALEVLRGGTCNRNNLFQAIDAAQHNCLRVAVSRAVFHVQGALSLMHHTPFSSQRLSELFGKYKAASSLIDNSNPRNDLFKRLVLEFKGALLSLRFALAFLRGDWPEILYSLRSCEVSLQVKESTPQEDVTTDREAEDNHSMTSGCSSLAPDSVSVEALRHMASNPAILGISKSLSHIRRKRKTPSMTMVGISSGSAATISDDWLGTPTLSVKPDDPYAVIRIHPALSCTLAAASTAYLAAHLASRAAEFERKVTEVGRRNSRSQQQQLFWQSESGKGYDHSFRLIRASEALEHIAEDALAQWAPLQRFGIEVNSGTLSQPEESAGAFVDLWSTLGCLPEYAPSLSEAATVAAAELAAAASRAAIEAAEQKDGGRRRRRRRERRGEYVQSVAKEGLKLFDTTSADSLYGAYPVRFSASASGPWSGRGKHASLYREDRALFRTLCISAADPPAVIVATPKGIQEIVPSSYTTIPAGFRSHYLAKKTDLEADQEDKRLEALARDREIDSIEENRHEDDSFLSSYDGFGEGPYVALELEANDAARNRALHTRPHGGRRKAVWRHQVQATSLAAHPLRRRFASGGTDGVVRLWGYADPISLAAFREDHYGRIADLCFSAYGNTMLAVYSSGHVTIWDDPDVYSSQRITRGSRGTRAKVIRAFDNRAASGGAFLDERHTIAVVGDPTAPPSVGHSLRIFDSREPHSSFHASWSAAVNHQSEARCLALLEDRMRLVTGGLDGSLSIVDIRTKTCIAELPAHADEVKCLALEMPRGRALVSGSTNGEIKLWDSRTLRQLDVIQEAHKPTRHYWSGNGIGGLVGSYGTQGLALTDRSLISCGGDGVVKIWGPGWSDFDLNVL